MRDSGDRHDREETTQVIGLEMAAKPIGPRDCCTLTMLAGPTPGAVFAVESDEAILGRGREVSMRIDDPGMSRRHARIHRRADGFWLEDLGSTNGTFLNGEQVTHPCRVQAGDRIQVGTNAVLQVALQDEVELRAAKQLYESATRDPLTQVYNRRHLDERLRGEFAFALRHGAPLSLLVLDVDHFKKVNDTYGHPAGDAVLKSLAHTLTRNVRTEDLVARYGGEEFVVVARGTPSSNASTLAERIRASVASTEVLWQGTALRVTVSIGVASMQPDRGFQAVEALVSAADNALYKAKSSGRNRVVIA